jgi:hypothetical protein
MTDKKLAGTRCRANRHVQSNTGRIERFSEGRIRFVTENLGRTLFLVEWDRGGSTMLFPEEIELVEAAA